MPIGGGVAAAILKGYRATNAATGPGSGVGSVEGEVPRLPRREAEMASLDSGLEGVFVCVCVCVCVRARLL